MQSKKYEKKYIIKNLKILKELMIYYVCNQRKKEKLLYKKKEGEINNIYIYIYIVDFPFFFIYIYYIYLYIYIDKNILPVN